MCIVRLATVETQDGGYLVNSIKDLLKKIDYLIVVGPEGKAV